MDEYEALYNQSYGDLNSNDTSSGFDDLYSKLESDIFGQNDSVDTNNPTPTNNNVYSGASFAPVKPVQGRDEDVVALARAIRQHESGGKYDAKGGSGEYGAYQFMPSTWQDWSKKWLGDANAPMSQENQNKVAYEQIKSWKDQGYNASQIASLWNSGSPDWKGKVGVNKYGVKYDTPSYVQNVVGYAKQFAPTQAMASDGDVSRETPMPVEEQGKSVGGFVKNLGSSALDFTKGIVSAVTHPVRTVKSIANLGLGAMDNFSDFQNKAIDGIVKNPKANSAVKFLAGKANPMTLIPSGIESLGINLDAQNEMADNLGRTYKERYGGGKNIVDTAYNDPVGVLADVATLFSGGASVAGKVGTVGKVGTAGKLGKASGFASKLAGASEVSSNLSKVARVVDPITYISKATGAIAKSKAGQFVKNIPSNLVGLTTGQGGGTFRQIYDAARNGRKGAVEAMRGGVDDAQMVQKLDDAVGEIGKLKQKEWEKLGLDKMGDSLDISKIYSDLESGLNDLKISVLDDGSLDFSRARGSIRYDNNAQSRVTKIVDSMRGYGLKKGDRLPSSVDDLKQSFASLFDDSSEVKGFVEKMRKSARTVLDDVNGYDEYARNYGELQETINQLKYELSAGNKNASTTWRKVVNTFKQRNTEGRQQLLQTLQDRGISDLIDNIAGYGASNWFPSDIVRGGILPTMSATSGNVLAIPAYSPRAVGETANFLGNSVGKTKRVIDRTGSTKGGSVVKYLGGQAFDKNKMTRNSTLIERSRKNEDQSQ